MVAILLQLQKAMWQKGEPYTFVPIYSEKGIVHFGTYFGERTYIA